MHLCLICYAVIGNHNADHVLHASDVRATHKPLHMISCDTLQGSRPHIFGMTASPVNTRAKQTQAKIAEAVWQLERNMDAQVITVIDRNPVVAAAPLPELKLLYYAREHKSEPLKDVQGG